MSNHHTTHQRLEAEIQEQETSAAIAAVTLAAAEVAWISGDDSKTLRLASDAAYEARRAGDIETAVKAAGLAQLARGELYRHEAFAGWGTR